jgi:hypothetical protein
LIEQKNEVKIKGKEQEEVERIPQGLVISPRCHQKIRKAYCKSSHVLGEKNCSDGGGLMAQGRGEFRTSGKKRKREKMLRGDYWTLKIFSFPIL